MIKSRRMRWTGHVARMGRRGEKERDHYEDQKVGEWTMLKRILEREDGVV
jgi:hypothetical protein